MAELLELEGTYSSLALRRYLAKCSMLSSDVSAAPPRSRRRTPPSWGAAWYSTKYIDVRGKSGSNDANAEYVAYVRKLMDDAGVAFQTAELGRVDVVVGGTIAYIMALYGMSVIDCGIPVFSMHAPYELSGKSDIFEAVKGYTAFHSGEVMIQLANAQSQKEFGAVLGGKLIREGGLVAFPTETVYGLGANGFDGETPSAAYSRRRAGLTCDGGHSRPQLRELALLCDVEYERVVR